MTSILRPLVQLTSLSFGATVDEVIESGSPKFDPTVGSEISVALTTRRGSWPGDREFGSGLGSIKKATTNAASFAETDIRRTLAFWTARGEINALTVETAIFGNQFRFLLVFRDSSNKELRVPFTHNVSPTA